METVTEKSSETREMELSSKPHTGPARSLDTGTNIIQAVVKKDQFRD